MAPRRSSKASSVLVVLVVFLAYLAGWFARVWVEHELPTPAEEISHYRYPAIPKALSEPSMKKVFMQNHTFDLGSNSHATHEAWQSYNSRFISLDSSRSLGLPPSIKTHDDRQMYSVAAYHQLHCVHVIQYSWTQLKTKGPAVLEEPYPGMEAMLEGYTIEGHVSHCLDMVRQALECFADPTLEPMMNDDGKTLSNGLASGWGGSPHVCRDISALTTWIDAPEQHPIRSVETVIDT